jgi:hypothetical protein
MPISTIDLSKAVSSTNSYQIDYLVVAGGGSGGYDVGGGGGAGGYLSASCPVFTNTAYPVVIGSGGATPVNGQVQNRSQNSSFGGFAEAIGGGAGGNWDASGFYKNGCPGGSGGGGGGYTNSSLQGQPSSGNQGNAGGPATTSGVGSQTGGGGGGAGGIGATSITGSTTAFVSGGVGLTWYDGVTYAAGGRGAADGSTGYLPGAANTGNGGDGMGSGSTSTAGGSGIVIVRYAGAQRGTGGTVTSSGGYTYHKFTTSGTYTA